MAILKRCHLSRNVDDHDNQVGTREVKRKKVVAGSQAFSLDDCSAHGEISNDTNEENEYV